MDELRGSILRAEVEARLRPVCPDWPESLFQAVVSHIVEITLKYDHAGKDSFSYDPRIAEQMVAEMRILADRSAEVRADLPGQPAPPKDS